MPEGDLTYSLLPLTYYLNLGWKMGLEPTVSSATNWRFNQLSYIHHSAKPIITYLWCLSRKSCIYLQKIFFPRLHTLYLVTVNYNLHNFKIYPLYVK